MNNLGILALAVIAFGCFGLHHALTSPDREAAAAAKIAAESRPTCCSTPGAQPVYRDL